MARAEPTEVRPSPDDEGFRQWVTVRRRQLRRRAFLLCGDWYQADDLLQDTLVAMYQKWRRVARGRNVDVYANRVLMGKYIDGTRRFWRREHVTDRVPERPDVSAQRSFAEAELSNSVLSRALIELSPDQRAILVLRYADDLSISDIAEALNVPAGTVKSRLSRTIQALREVLGEASSHDLGLDEKS